MAYARGDIVLVPFPFTDLSATKVRPALVVSDSDYERATGNLIVAQITGRMHSTPTDYAITGWQDANLLKPSIVRAKLATLSPSLVRHNPGKLAASDMVEVDKRLRLAMALS
ncbi:MAG: type II toxin-antitoxin system PemK/MazF family toxin [Anaerolineae bacterium]